MKTILSYLIALFGFALCVYGQEQENIESFDSKTSSNSDINTHTSGLEDLLKGRSKEERDFVNKMKQWTFFIDDEREIENMLNIFKPETIDEAFFDKMLNEYFDLYVDNFTKSRPLNFDFYKSEVQELQSDVMAEKNAISAFDQVWNWDDYQWYYEGFSPLTGFEENCAALLGDYYPLEIQVDTSGYEKKSFFKEDYRNKLLDHLTALPDKYQIGIYLLQELQIRGVNNDLLFFASFLSKSIATDHNVPKEFRKKTLISILKILSTSNKPAFSELMLTNYGRLYALIGEEDTDELQYVKLMELQCLNWLARKFPRKNRFVNEGRKILIDVVAKMPSDYSESVYLNCNLSLGELLIHQLANRWDVGKKMSDKHFTNLKKLCQWRLINLFYEFERYERNGNAIPIYFLDRLYNLLLKYYDTAKDEKKVIEHILGIIKEGEVSNKFAFGYLNMLPDVISSYGKEDIAQKWAKELNGFVLIDKVNDIMTKLTKGHNKPPYKFDSTDVAFWLSKESDTVIKIYDYIASVWDKLPGEMRSSLKFGGWSLFEYEKFFVEHKEYEKAYIYGNLGRLVRNDEYDTELYSQLIIAKNMAESKTRTIHLNWELDKVIGELEFKNQELTRVEAVLVLKIRDLSAKDLELSLKDSLITSAKLELIEIQNQKDAIDFDLTKAIEDRNRIEEENGTMKELIRQKDRAMLIRNWLLVSIIIALISVLWFWRKAVNNRKLAENRALIIKRERDIAEGLRISIGQIGHLCQSGISNIVREYFRFSKDQLVLKGRSALGHLSNTFVQFRANRNTLVNRIEDEVGFAVELVFFQHPQFCEEKTKDDLLSMINFESVKDELVPIYTVANIVSNFFNHSILDEENRMKLSQTEGKEHCKTITLECFAKHNKNKGTGEGMKYVDFMIKTVHGGEEVLRHYPIKDDQYVTILNLKKRSA